jgi:MinD-like ATPase involved in chromosome partitioning or flagellar assembly
MPEFPVNFDIVFDLGGHMDSRAVAAIEQSNCVIVPLFAEESEIEVTLPAIDEIAEHHGNLIIVVNRQKRGERDEVEKVLRRKGLNFPVLGLSQSAALRKIRSRKISLRAAHDSHKSKWRKSPYEKAAQQFEEIIKMAEKS